MSLIPSAAYLKVCENCGQHGWIIFSNGRFSQSLDSQSEAMEVIAQAQAAGILMKEEVMELTRQVKERLPDGDHGKKVLSGIMFSLTLSPVSPTDSLLAPEVNTPTSPRWPSERAPLRN